MSDVGLCACRFSCALDPRSSAWHRCHRAVHLEVFPRADAETRTNLDTLVELHEFVEEQYGVGAVVGGS